MDHTLLIEQWFQTRQYRTQFEWNCLQPDYNPVTGWPMRLPKVNWLHTDFVVIVFQDFVTMRDGICLELRRVEQQYGSRAGQIIVIHWPHALATHYRGPVRLVEFNWHEYQILHTLRQCQDQWQQVWHMNRDLAWQCLNGRRCPHRIQVTQHLQQHWLNGTVSLGDTVPLPGYAYKTYRGTSNEDNWQRLIPVYGRHHFNIVTETQYDQTPGIITEKTIFAILAAQIPIVIGYPGIVEHCEELGFDMFRDIVDVSYDHLPDDRRWQAALDLNRDRVMRYRPDSKITRRLLRQARWLLTEWPQQQANLMLQQLDQTVMARG